MDRKPRSADPLAVFVDAHRRTLPKARADRRFNAGEHLWLGSRGAEVACEELLRGGGPDLRDAFRAIRRPSGVALDYGELVGLSGDFYETPEDLFDEKPSPVPWLWEDNDLSDLRDLFAEELRWIEARQKSAQGPPYPANDVRLWWNAKAYVDLALRNDAHFGWHNVLAYVTHHQKALEEAREARGRPLDDLGFRRALYRNAFADHFLTDGFAAGHVRVPRAEIRAWKGDEERLAGALSKVLHDQDGHVDESSLHGVHDELARAPTDGLHVQNSRGVSWYARCDGQLFLYPGSQASPAVAQAVAAVATSVGELLRAWRLGALPEGTFRATELVPFPHPDLPPLAARFPADMPQERFGALLASVGWYARIPWIVGLGAEELRGLLREIPALMASFRANVAKDVAEQGERVKRIAPAYVEAFGRLA